MIFNTLNKENKQSGYTLVELLIYLGLFTILMTILTTMFISILELRAKTEITTAVEQDGRYLMTKLQNVMRDTETILLPASDGDTTTQLLVSRDSITELYEISGDNLVRTISGDSVQLNSADTTVTNFSVSRLGNVGGNSTISLSVTVESAGQLQGEQETQTFTTSIGIR